MLVSDACVGCLNRVRACEACARVTPLVRDSRAFGCETVLRVRLVREITNTVESTAFGKDFRFASGLIEFSGVDLIRGEAGAMRSPATFRAPLGTELAGFALVQRLFAVST